MSDALEREIYALADLPRPPGCLKMSGQGDEWRIRVGDWRVGDCIDDGRVMLIVVRVAPRGRGAPGKRSGGPVSAPSAR